MHKHEGRILKNYLRNKEVTHQSIADLTGVSRNTVLNYLKLENLPVEFRAEIEKEHPNWAVAQTEVGFSIPYYEHADAICGNSEHKNLDEQSSFPIYLPGARVGDFAINARGQSLIGVVESGMILGLREVFDYDLIIYGELYFICTNSFERAKKIMPGKDKKHIRLVSTDQERFPDVEIPKNKITQLYKIWYKGELL